MDETTGYKKYEVQVQFMSPGSRLAGQTYDENGNKIKDYNEPFSKKDIEDLKAQGIQRLYYVKERPKTETEPAKENEAEPLLNNEMPIEPVQQAANDQKTADDIISDLEKRPKALICSFEHKKEEFFIPRLIANGIALYKAQQIEEAERYLMYNQLSHLIIDIDVEGKKWLHLVADYRSKYPDMQIYILYSPSSRTLLELFEDKGFVDGHFDKGMDIKEMVKRVIESINASDPHSSTRIHIKTMINENDNVTVRVIFSEDQIIQGKVYYISPLEFSFVLSDVLKGVMYNFSKGDKLNRITLNIQNKVVVTQGEVTEAKTDSNSVTIRFTHRSESLLRGIGKILMEKLKKISY